MIFSRSLQLLLQLGLLLLKLLVELPALFISNGIILDLDLFNLRNLQLFDRLKAFQSNLIFFLKIFTLKSGSDFISHGLESSITIYFDLCSVFIILQS